MFISKTIAAVLAMAGGMSVSTLAAQAQTTWYVDHANGCPGTGTEGDPFCLIQDGIDAAVKGDEVVVADGTYTGDGNRDLDFNGKLITVRSANGPGNCIIDSEGSEGDPHRGFFFHNGETVEAVVDGFSITGGNRGNGAGVYCASASSPTVTNCTFDGNSATNGGGMYCRSGSAATVTNCTFDGNSATNGGGMYNSSSNPTVADCTFSGNSATSGGGMYCTGASPTISNCAFTENIVTGSGSAFTGTGGAIHLLSSSPTIDNCFFARNTATASVIDTGKGGAIMIRSNSSPFITSCTFIDNEAVGGSSGASGRGGGLAINQGSDAILRDCILVGNKAIVGNAAFSGFGGGIVTFESDAELTNCIFIGNKAIGASEPPTVTGAGGAFDANLGTSILTNCIFAGNSATGEGDFNGAGGAIKVYNDAQLTNCAIIGNSADLNGGGLWIDYSTLTTLTNCTLSGNSADSDGDGVGSGGGIFSTSIFSNSPVATFVDNSIVWANGSNPIVDEPGYLAVTTVTYSDVEGGWDGLGGTNINADPLFVGGPSGGWTADGVYYPDEGQTILTDANANDGKGWGEDTLVGMFINPDISQTLQSLIVANSATTVVMWADFSGMGTMGTDYQIRDYDLTDSSPCIDAGDNTAVPADEPDLDGDGDTDEPIPFDCDGNPRFVDDPLTLDCPQAPGTCGDAPVVDMGACEFQLCPADFDDDGTVGASDLAQLLGSWGPYESCPPYHAADFDEDCDVSAADLAQLLGDWGPCE